MCSRRVARQLLKSRVERTESGGPKEPRHRSEPKAAPSLHESLQNVRPRLLQTLDAVEIFMCVTKLLNWLGMDAHFVHALAPVLPQILTARRKHEHSDTEGGGGQSSSGWSDSDDSSG